MSDTHAQRPDDAGLEHVYLGTGTRLSIQTPGRLKAQDSLPLFVVLARIGGAGGVGDVGLCAASGDFVSEQS